MHNHICTEIPMIPMFLSTHIYIIRWAVIKMYVTTWAKIEYSIQLYDNISLLWERIMYHMLYQVVHPIIQCYFKRDKNARNRMNSEHY